jgi:putative chitinase
MSLIKRLVQECAPNANKQFVANLDEECDQVLGSCGMLEREVIIRFLARCHHETAGFTVFTENAFYSKPERIKQIWPSRFPTVESAKPYARNPEAILNKVYANRMGNGGEETGDGYRYRGSGLTQHTGKAEFDRVMSTTGVTSKRLQDPSESIAQISAAASFWVAKKVISAARNMNDALVTKKINGGLIGLEDTVKLTKRYGAAFDGKPVNIKVMTRPETQNKANQRVKQISTLAVATPATASVPSVQESVYAPIVNTFLFIALLIAGMLIYLNISKRNKLKIESEIDRQESVNSYEAMK